jgi:phenylacetate-CoA ligase
MSIARILKHYSSIIQWQFIQNSRSEYLLKLTVREYLCEEDEIKKALLELFGNNATIQFQLVDEIPILASGKRKPVVNNWKK